MVTNKLPTKQLVVKQSNIVLFKRCLGYFSSYKPTLFFACIAMAIAGVSTAGTAWLVKDALDDIFIAGNRTALFLIPLFFVILTLVKVTCRLLQNYLMQRVGLKVLETLRDELYTKIMCLPLQFYEGSQVGMLMSRIINDVVAIRSSLPAVVMMIRQVITMAALIGLVFYQNATLAFWAVVVLPLAFFPFIYCGKRLRKLGRKNQSQMADISSLLQEILSGIRVVKAFSTEQQERVRFDSENKRLLRISLKQCLTGEFSSSGMELVGALGIALVIWFGGVQVMDKHMTVGTFFSFVTGLVMLYEPIKKLTAANSDLQKALAGAERVFEILDDPNIKEEQGGTTVFDGNFQTLALKNVSLSYPDGTMALKNVSFTIHAGERIAIVGPSGAGKTTFVNIIPRFYEPQQGQILLNDIPLQDYTLDSLRSAISLVSQDSFLFNVSVANNITYGQVDYPEEIIHAAAKAAFAHDFILAMPEGYNTIIGERGVKLSGGQKQRLTIARALIKNSPLLILDEATSALDSESERIVQKALENLMKNRTSIVIAHRLSTVIDADRIIVMQDGAIVGEGTHEELLASNPLYIKLYTTQFSTPALADKTA